MLGGLGEAGSTLGQWDGTGEYNSPLMSGSRLMSNQDLLLGHKSGGPLHLLFVPCTVDCNSYLSLHRQDPVPACHPHLALGSLLCGFLGGMVQSTKPAKKLLPSFLCCKPSQFCWLITLE